MDRVYHDHDGDDEAYWEARELDDAYSDLFDMNDAAGDTDAMFYAFAPFWVYYGSEPPEPDDPPDDDTYDQPGYEKALDIALTEAKSHGV